MKNETINFTTENGDTTAFVVLPEKSNGKAVLVIQEWWGLNDHVKDIAGRYASEGFTAIAPDLYRGELATNAEDASKMMHNLALDDGIATIKAAIKAASEKYQFETFGITGYCMGGTCRIMIALVRCGNEFGSPRARFGSMERITWPMP
ncbi:dienelactone hydrolase family protein [Leptolyngbya sp. 7M]|uniref:dienelactone hydrolase family protein n=1 Tax=Leptolyngbya sp. 7M TaxID=2812896 RepID=UPI001CECD3D1|nr:dienelactone hydrolase family protein [Leptolyngbya sp. 7M]